jgi:predicted phosphodiesterase
MPLADDYDDYPAVEESPWTPRVEFDGTSGYVQTGPLAVGVDVPDVIGKILTDIGYDTNTMHIGRTLKASHWQQARGLRDAEGHKTGESETQWLHAVKVELLVGPHLPPADIEAIVLRTRKRSPSAGAGAHWFVFQGADQQIGKISRDGSTEQIIERYVESVEAAKVEFKRLKKVGIEGIQICLPGDCIEGNQSQGGRNMRLTKETVPEQTRILRRLMFYTVETFAPLVDQVYLDVVNGNHDDSDRRLNSYPGDGWATEAATAIEDMLKLNPTAYGHVTVRVPEKWSHHMTVPVGDTIVTVAHGHKWRRPERAFTWWAEQAVNCEPPGAAQVLQHGHYHTWQIRQSATKTVIGAPTYDMGSDWFRDVHGESSRRGGLVYLMAAGAVSNMTVM